MARGGLSARPPAARPAPGPRRRARLGQTFPPFADFEETARSLDTRCRHLPRMAAAGGPGRYPARAGGLWLCRTRVLSLFHAVVVPSGLTTRVQPQRWM